MNVVDSSGWIEFFRAGANGPAFKPIIEDRARLLVPTIDIFAVHRVLRRSLPALPAAHSLDPIGLGRALDLTDARAIAASHIAAQHKLAMADAAMYAIALEFGATFWTQDVDYQGLPSVRYQAKPSA